MKVFGIAGHSGMGKTTLLERLVPELHQRGLKVSIIKHSHKDVEVDRPGKDSYRLREAGCEEVLLVGGSRWALMHELRESPEPRLRDLLRHMGDCDLVLIEGFKTGRFPRLEVWRSAPGSPPLWPATTDIVATAGDPLPRSGELPAPPRLELEATATIADLVLREAASMSSLRWRRVADVLQCYLHALLPRIPRARAVRTAARPVDQT